jgi:hypothetical protein
MRDENTFRKDHAHLLEACRPVGRVVTGIGHDDGGYEITLKFKELKNLKVRISDDGWGGGIEWDYPGDSPRGKAATDALLKDYFARTEIPKHMRDSGGWGDLIKDEELKNPNLDRCLSFLAYEWLNLKEEEKEAKAKQRFIKNNSKKGLVYEKPGGDGVIGCLNWKHELSLFVERYGVEQTQEMVENAASKIPPGSKLLNENLESLGLKKPQIPAISEEEDSGIKI